MKNGKINWGIIAPGHIAQKFARALKEMEKQQDNICCYGVASRNPDKARSFAQEFGFLKSFESYEQLLEDPELDAVYIASPHNLHYEQTLMALGYGKHVLCEKPACLNQQQLSHVLDVAQEKNLFYMEATWTCFIPTVKDVMAEIASGTIGNILTSNISFCFRNSYNPEGRLFNPMLAGGALLDVGIYPLTFAMLAARANSDLCTKGMPKFSLFDTDSKMCEPRKITSTARISKGVDLWNSMALTFADGTTASLSSSIDIEPAENAKNAYIYGTKGYIKVTDFWMAQKAEIYTYTGESGSQANLVKSIENPFIVNGYEYEILEATQCIAEGKKQSSWHCWEDSMAVLKAMDIIRSQWKLSYPQELEKVLEDKNSSGNGNFLEEKTTMTQQNDNNAKNTGPLVVYTDGGCSGNPGPGGWGTVIIDGAQENQYSGGEKNTTNNRMELMAAIKALETIALNPQWKNRQIQVYSDSQYVKNGITSWINGWKKNGWKTAAKKPVLNKELWVELDQYYSQLDVQWSWVKGHAGVKYNEICDSLCQEQIAKHR